MVLFISYIKAHSSSIGPPRKVLVHFCSPKTGGNEYDFQKLGYFGLPKNHMATLPSICHINLTHSLDYISSTGQSEVQGVGLAQFG